MIGLIYICVEKEVYSTIFIINTHLSKFKDKKIILKVKLLGEKS